VNDADYHPPFRFTGSIDKLTLKIGPEQFTSNDRQIIERALANARD
jgi:arylsulfatase